MIFLANFRSPIIQKFCFLKNKIHQSKSDEKTIFSIHLLTLLHKTANDTLNKKEEIKCETDWRIYKKYTYQYLTKITIKTAYGTQVEVALQNRNLYLCLIVFTCFRDIPARIHRFTLF